MKICFFSPLAYPLLRGEETDKIGGAEIQQVFLGKAIKEKFSVSFIDEDEGCEETSQDEVDNIIIYSIPLKKNFLRRFIFLLKVLNKVDADIYIKRGAGGTVGVMALFCLLNNKKFIYSVASDTDIDGSLIKDSFLKHLNPGLRFLYKQMFNFGLLYADGIITQNEYQKNLLRENYNKDSTIIKKGYPVPPKVGNKEKIVLWVGNIKEIKQPEIFLELAEKLPKIKFQMIGGRAKEDSRYHDKIKVEAEKILNLEFLGYVPFNQIDSYFERASVFVGTSEKEGDPTTYYQAWLNKTPVVSLYVDPDDIIKEENIGFCSGSFKQLVRDVKKLMENEELRKRMGDKGREYIKENRSLEKMGKEFEEFLLSFDKNTS